MNYEYSEHFNLFLSHYEEYDYSNFLKEKEEIDQLENTMNVKMSYYKDKNYLLKEYEIKFEKIFETVQRNELLMKEIDIILNQTLKDIKKQNCDY